MNCAHSSHVSGRRPTGPLVAAAAALCLALTALSPLARASFNAWEACGFKLGPIKCNADGTLKPLTQAERAMVQNLATQLMKPLNPDANKRYAKDSGLGLTAVQAWEKIECIRQNMKLAVDLAEGMLTDADCRKWLRSQAESGNICVGWGMKVGATVNIDRESDVANCMPKKRASEQLLVNIEWTMKDKYKPHDSLGLALADMLLHETTHAGQLYKPSDADLPKNPTADQRRAALGKTYAMNEMDAHSTGEVWQGALSMLLCDPDSYDPDKPLPADIDNATKKVLESLRGITPAAARNAAAAKLKRHMAHYAKHNRIARECYEKAKEAFCDFLMDGDRAALKRKLADAQWARYISWLDSPSFVAADPPFILDQTSGVDDEDGPSIDTGVEVKSFLVLLNAPVKRLLVAGRGENGLGQLLLYSDFDGDSYFDPESREVLVADEPRLQLNMQLIHDPDRGDVYIFDALSGSIYPLIDLDGDGVPDTIGLNSVIPPDPIFPPDPIRPIFDSVLTFTFARGFEVPTLIGYSVIDTLYPSLPDDEPALLIIDNNDDGFFESHQVMRHDDVSLLTPTFERGALVPGALAVEVYGRRTRPLEVWLCDADGLLLKPLGFGLGQGVSFSTLVPLLQPLSKGDFVLVRDPKTGESSFPAPVMPPDSPCPADLNGDGSVNAADLALLLGAWGPTTGSPADLNGDGFVNASDLALMLGSWGPCP